MASDWRLYSGRYGKSIVDDFRSWMGSICPEAMGYRGSRLGGRKRSVDLRKAVVLVAMVRSCVLRCPVRHARVVEERKRYERYERPAEALSTRDETDVCDAPDHRDPRARESSHCRTLLADVSHDMRSDIPVKITAGRERFCRCVGGRGVVFPYLR